jgi:endonuclease/exonuclease/phosphatase family metal-dependent hydrolase
MLSCAPGRPVVAPVGPVRLAVIAWNLSAGRGDLARLASDLASGELTGAPVANAVLLLQEATPSTALAGFDSHFVAVRQSPERTSGNLILSTRPLDDRRAIPLPAARQPRTAAVATIEIGRQRVFVASVHLENRLAWSRLAIFADGARGRQAAALVAGLPAGPGVVGGDMNTILGPHEPAWRRLRARFDDTPDTPAQPTFRDRLVLDHLFFDLPDGWLGATDVVADRYGSDHHPVIGLIR